MLCKISVFSYGETKPSGGHFGNEKRGGGGEGEGGKMECTYDKLSQISKLCLNLLTDSILREVEKGKCP